jgi:hypothetical protein
MERYSYTTGGRVMTLFVFVGLGAAAVYLLFLAVTGLRGPGLVFTFLWLGALAWNAYWWLWRTSYRIEVAGDRLRWMTPIRRGEVSVSDVEAIRPGLLNQVTIIEVREGPDVICLSRTGIAEFAAAIAGDRDIPVSARIPLSERLSGAIRGSAFERER